MCKETVQQTQDNTFRRNRNDPCLFVLTAQRRAMNSTLMHVSRSSQSGAFSRSPCFVIHFCLSCLSKFFCIRFHLLASRRCRHNPLAKHGKLPDDLVSDLQAAQAQQFSGIGVIYHLHFIIYISIAINISALNFKLLPAKGYLRGRPMPMTPKM